jgi:hypothetical protein
MATYKEAVEALAQSIRAAGFTYEDAIAAVKAVYGVRTLYGFDVVRGWEMPEPPQPGLKPVCRFEGTDGISLFWWDPAKSEYPTYPDPALNWWIDENPLEEPDTGYGYKDCAQAYEELGFYVE